MDLFQVAGYTLPMDEGQIKVFNERIQKNIQSRFNSQDISVLVSNLQSEMLKKLEGMSTNYVKKAYPEEPRLRAYYTNFLVNPYKHLFSNPLLFVFLPFILRRTPLSLYGTDFAQLHQVLLGKFKRESSYDFSASLQTASPQTPPTQPPAAAPKLAPEPQPQPVHKQHAALPSLPEDTTPLDGFPTFKDFFNRYPILKERLAAENITTFGTLINAMNAIMSFSPRRIFDLLEGRENAIQQTGRGEVPNIVFSVMCRAAKMDTYEVARGGVKASPGEAKPS
jgi:hypothetical protein